MQLVMKFTQAYVNTHANKLFSLSFWPVASAGGICDLKLCPARIRIPKIDTEKKTDPSFNGIKSTQVTYTSDGVQWSWLTSMGKDRAISASTRRKDASGMVLKSHPTP